MQTLKPKLLLASILFFGFFLLQQDIELPQAQAERAKVYKSKGKSSGRARRGVRARSGKGSRTSGTSGIPMTTADFCQSEFNFFLDHRKATRKSDCKFKIAKDFKDAVETDFKACIKEASEQMGWGQPAFISIVHDGCYVPRNARNSGQRSSHATGRGLDINKIELDFFNSTTRDGKESIDFKKGTGHPQFYSSVRDCWGKKNPCNRSIGFVGSRNVANGKSNSLHNDHLHISKTCPPQLAGHATY